MLGTARPVGQSSGAAAGALMLNPSLLMWARTYVAVCTAILAVKIDQSTYPQPRARNAKKRVGQDSAVFTSCCEFAPYANTFIRWQMVEQLHERFRHRQHREAIMLLLSCGSMLKVSQAAAARQSLATNQFCRTGINLELR